MSKFYISPRLNFDFSSKDLLIAIRGLFYGKNDTSKLEDYFPGSELHFMNHARTGLLLVLQALELPKGSKVGVIVYNCLTVFEAIKKAGYCPVFIDVDYNYRMSMEDFHFKENQLDAIVVTHLFGIPSHIVEIIKSMKERPVIEDCAHAFLNKHDNKYLGTFGVASIFSFGHAKFPAAAEGGVVLINDKKYLPSYLNRFSKLENYKKSKALKNVFKAFMLSILMNRFIYKLITLPIKNKLNDQVDINQKYVFNEKLCNSGFKNVFEDRMSNIDELISKQKNNAVRIAEHFQKIKMTSEIVKDEASFMVPITTEDPDQFIEESMENGIELGRHFLNSLNWARQYDSFEGNFPNAEYLLSKTVTIPCHYKLRKGDIARITSIES